MTANFDSKTVREGAVPFDALGRAAPLRVVAAQAPGPDATDDRDSDRYLPAVVPPVRGRLFLVSGARGGVGATTFAVNLALQLGTKDSLFGAAQTAKVAIVDFDVQFGNVAALLDIVPRSGILDLARLEPEPDSMAVANSMRTHASGIRVLPAPQIPMPLEALDAERVSSILDVLMAEYDYVVVDMPPALVTWLEPLIARAHRMMMVTDLSVAAVTSGRRVIDVMREDNPALVVDVVVSREKRPLIERGVQREARKVLQEPLRHWLPDEPKLARQAGDRGEPLTSLAPRAPWSRAVKGIAAQLEAETAETSQVQG